MSTSTNQKPMWQVSFGPAPGRCHAATSTLTILDTSAPLRKCTRPRPWPHSAVAARPLSARATATCDTLLRVTPFRGAPRASACLPSSGRPLLRHPAPPRPSVKRATSPLPPVNRPPPSPSSPRCRHPSASRRSRSSCLKSEVEGMDLRLTMRWVQIMMLTSSYL